MNDIQHCCTTVTLLPINIRFLNFKRQFIEKYKFKMFEIYFFLACNYMIIIQLEY